LENAGGAGDTGLITEHLPGFRQDLAALTAQISAALQTAEQPAETSAEASAEASAQTPSTLDRETLLRLRTALEQLEVGIVDLTLDELMAGECGEHEKRILSKISMCVLLSEFEEAVALLDNLLEAGNR
jgi:small-conductance mechanosensitive channel